jgi:surface carbohydrate biosynthesis protein
MKNNRLIYLPVEVSKRELFYKTNFALALLNDKTDVMLGKQYDIPKTAFSDYNTIVYLDKSLTKNSFYDIQNLTQYGVNVFCLDEEGLVHKRDRAWWANHRIYEPALELIDGYFCYNVEQQQSLCKIFPKFSDKFILSGSPKFDISLKRIMVTASKPDVDALFVSNFIFSRNKGGPNFVLKNLEKLGRLYNEDERHYWNGLMSHSNAVEKEFYSLIKSTCEQFPLKKFKIRPHPAEDETLWVELANRMPNLWVDNNHSIETSISKSKCVVHNNCTSAIQSVFLETLTIAFTPFGDSTYDANLPNKISHNQVKSFDYFRTFIKCDTNLLSANQEFKDHVPSAANRIMSKILNKSNGKVVVESNLNLAQKTKEVRRKIRKILQALGLKDHNSKYMLAKLEGFNEAQVWEYIEMFSDNKKIRTESVNGSIKLSNSE